MTAYVVVGTIVGLLLVGLGYWMGKNETELHYKRREQAARRKEYFGKDEDEPWL
ncbi:MAG: hypothetical protein ACYDH4_08700 [Candidatus Cryosericum sp.]